MFCSFERAPSPNSSARDDKRSKEAPESGRRDHPERRSGEPEEVWRSYKGRAGCERVFKVAKHALGMSWRISHELRANNAAFLLRSLTDDMDITFQRHVEKLATDLQRAAIRQGLPRPSPRPSAGRPSTAALV